MVVLNGKTVRINGTPYTGGQTFRATPKQARLWSKLGRAQVDPAGVHATRVEDLPKPTASDLRDVMRQQREKVMQRPDEEAETAPAPAGQRRRTYRRRDMTAQA